MKKLLLLIICVFFIPALAWGVTIPTVDKAGLDDMIQENKGKVIMLNFFATWCPPCKAEIPEIVKLRAAWPKSKLSIIGLSVDENKAEVPPFIDKLKVNYPIFMAGRDITDYYKVTSVPHNAFIAPDGKLVISEPGMADEVVLKQVVEDLLK